MSQEVRRAILESSEDVVGSFPVQWNGGSPPRGRLSADPSILSSLFDRLFSLTAEGLGTVTIRFIDEDGTFVRSSAHLLPQGESAFAAAAASGR